MNGVSLDKKVDMNVGRMNEWLDGESLNIIVDN